MLLMWLFSGCDRDAAGSPGDTQAVGDTTSGDTEGDTSGSEPSCSEADDDALPAFGAEWVPMGVGGGGTMAGLAMSPFDPDLWFVDTDMGTVFRSTDAGTTWAPVPERYLPADSAFAEHVPVGFVADGTLLYSASGVGLATSRDAGATWSEVRDDVVASQTLRAFHPGADAHVWASTASGLIRSDDGGSTWSLTDLPEAPVGVFVDTAAGQVWAGTPTGVWVSDAGSGFRKAHEASLRGFAGGRSGDRLRLAVLTDAPSACAAQGGGSCGWVQTSTDGTAWTDTGQVGGAHLTMAGSDPDTLYVTGSEDWAEGTGTSVWVSEDGGGSFTLRLLQLDWTQVPYAPWPLLDWSAVGIETGWDDGGYASFAVNGMDSCNAGGSQLYFLHTTRNRGRSWDSPFTRFADTGERTDGKRWQTRGLEVVSVQGLEWHPTRDEVGLAPTMDQSLQRTDDGGATWTLVDPADYAFCSDGEAAEDLRNVYDVAWSADGTRVWAVGGSFHDWPHNGYQAVVGDVGGVYLSEDAGMTWAPLFCEDQRAQRQYLSAAYAEDATGGEWLVLGSMGHGLFVVDLSTGEVQPANEGVGSDRTSVGQIEVDPTSGDVYALVSADVVGDGTIDSTPAGIWRLAGSELGSPRWASLRGTLHPPGRAPASALWAHPTTFGVDWTCAMPTCLDMDHRPVFLGELRGGADLWGQTGVWQADLGDLEWSLVRWMDSVSSVRVEEDTGRLWALAFFIPYYSGHAYPSDSVDADAAIAVDASGASGPGGIQYSDDGGRAWCKDVSSPLQTHANDVAALPSDSDRVVYSFHGGGMASAPRPVVCR